MPPWLPTTDGVPLERSMTLDDSERMLLARWLQAGAPLPEGATLDAPLAEPFDYDLEFDLPKHSVRDEQWRCFVIDVPHSLITGFQIEASDTVHHVLAGSFSGTDLQAMDDLDPGPGWSCPDLFMPESSHPPDSIPIYWFPDPRPTYTASGTASPLLGTTVLQVHGLGHGEASGTLRLQVDPSAIPEQVVSLGTGEVTLPEDQETVVVTRRGYLRDFAGTDDPLFLLGARGHGHEQLSTLSIDVDGERLLSLADWDPAFQSRYLFEQPYRAGPDAVITLTCTYDNSPEARRRAEIYGNGREMCGAWLFGTSSSPP